MSYSIKNCSNTHPFKIIFSIFILLLTFSFAKAQIVYVKPDGKGNGTSWRKATHDLSKALKNAEFGTKIWVAAGTYIPTWNNDRKRAFIIPDGIQLYGGFSGKETDFSQRDVTKNPTILSGEIGSLSKKDNSFNVIRLIDVSSATIIDGFIISDGFAMGKDEDNGSRYRSGAGIFNDGSNSKVGSNPVIRNCIFQNNYAMDGAAIYNNAFNGACSPQIENCMFIDNDAFTDGGAIFNDCKNHGKIRMTVINSQFEKNKSNNGGAIFGHNVTGRAYFEFTNCDFIQNTAHSRGGAIYDLSFDGKKPFTFNNCTFLENEAYEGDNIYIKENIIQVRHNEKEKIHRS